MDPALRFQPFDLLASLIAVVRADTVVVFSNAALEDSLGISRRAIVGAPLNDVFSDASALREAIAGTHRNAFAAMRYDAYLRRVGLESLPVHVIVTDAEDGLHYVVELVPLEQQTRQEREERLAERAQANKELIRNLAHEIKNPLGGIRGAAQLLQMEIESKDLIEFTQVIIREADRLQTLVDRLLAPHRRPHVVSNVNIHEVFERVRALILAEFPKGIKVQRDYDTSLPNFRGDLEQIIQAVLNIAHNAAQALADRIEQGDAVIILKSRVSRQISFSNQRNRLALELHVIDNGPGVPESIKDRLFSPLVSGRDGGSGLGLNLAQSFIQQHHGLIECESVKGRTDFKILLPLQ